MNNENIVQKRKSNKIGVLICLFVEIIIATICAVMFGVDKEIELGLKIMIVALVAISTVSVVFMNVIMFRYKFELDGQRVIIRRFKTKEYNKCDIKVSIELVFAGRNNFGRYQRYVVRLKENNKALINFFLFDENAEAVFGRLVREQENESIY